VLGVLVRGTERVKFALAHRPGLFSPTLFARAVDAVSRMPDGYLSLWSASISPAEQALSGDFPAHGERCARSDEFLEILHRFR
jgi:alkanesulfonate monooxygenase